MMGRADYMASLRTVRAMLERAGSAKLVRWEDLWANKGHVLAMKARIVLLRAGGSPLASTIDASVSEDLDELIGRLQANEDRESLAAEVLLDATPVIETRAGYVIESAPPAAA